MGGTGGGTDGDEGRSFEARLRAARERQGLEPRSDQPGPSRAGGLPTSALGIGLRVAIELVSALVLAVAIGWGLDRWLHTAPIFIALFVLLGGAAGVLNVWRLMGPGQGMRGRGG
jgi:ATP synthase protein I